MTTEQLIDEITNNPNYRGWKLEQLRPILLALLEGSGGEGSYKVYTALLNQSNTSAPVATVLENTLGGDVTYERNDEGVYIATATGLLTLNKTMVFTSNQGYGPGSGFTIVSTNNLNANRFYLHAGTSDTSPGDSLLVNTPLEIRVYD